MRGYDLTNKRFGRLVVLGLSDRTDKYNSKYWLCRCDCGKEKVIKGASLTRKNGTISCGCYQVEVLLEKGQPRTKKYNEYEVVGDTVYVKMAHDKVMMCDADDWEHFKHICWSCNKQGYATGRDMENKSLVKFHIKVMGKRNGYFVDHINRNRLDNRKANLRFLTPQENTWNIGTGKKNKSGVVGVSTQRGKWVATIGDNGKKHYIGIYNTKEEAIQARKEAEKTYQPLPERLNKQEDK